jgi:hypothetical protein
VLFTAGRIGVALNQDGGLAVLVHDAGEVVEVLHGLLRQGGGIHGEQDVAVKVDAQGVLIESLDLGIIQLLLQFLLLLVHVNANPGAHAGAHRGAAKHFVQFPVAHEQARCRADRRADGGALLGLFLRIIIGGGAGREQRERQGDGKNGEPPRRTGPIERGFHVCLLARQSLDVGFDYPRRS